MDTASEISWKEGYGVIQHQPETIARIQEMVPYLKENSLLAPDVDPYALLHAADRLANAGMWLVAHMTYTRKVYLDGRVLVADDFKREPEGHTGASLNMIPGYVGYMVMNAIMGKTRAWVIGQGHAVAAIDSVNLLLDNMTDAHKERYSLSDEGLTRYVRDFYSCILNAQGKQDTPLGSHVNPNTAGGHMESGYLGFTEVQYAHMPLPGERLVAFLSDGAFEEQRGSDWTPRWWREEDSGLITPIMIANGRRIDQRSTMSMSGGVEWFVNYLKLHNFDPFVFDGRDPAAFAWAIFESERRLKHEAKEIDSIDKYELPIPYGIAVAPKGAGFYNEGTNFAHNLPLVTNPSQDHIAANRFNTHAKKLYVPEADLRKAIATINNHEHTKRQRERDNPVANRDVHIEHEPALQYLEISEDRLHQPKEQYIAPIKGIDRSYIATVLANPQLRPRVGNPDEMTSNRMTETLQELKFRVTHPEGGISESVFGKVITALNEEAIAGAAFGNKGGINIIVTYEAFGSKIFGEARQEVIFSKHKSEKGRPAKWLSVPLVLTSHSWENGKNELSHQDSSMAESMFAETSDISRVFFPADYNVSVAVMEQLFKTQGQIWTIVVSKRITPHWFTRDESRTLVANGGMVIPWLGHKQSESKLCFIAMGTYQLMEIMKASVRLTEKDVPHRVAYILEPGRFRLPRNEGEAHHLAPEETRNAIFNHDTQSYIMVTHTRPELFIGAMMHNFSGKTIRGVGFINQGGTLAADGMLYVNKSSWAHLLQQAAQVLNKSENDLLSGEELDALYGKRTPDGIIHPEKSI